MSPCSPSTPAVPCLSGILVDCGVNLRVIYEPKIKLRKKDFGYQEVIRKLAFAAVTTIEHQTQAYFGTQEHGLITDGSDVSI